MEENDVIYVDAQYFFDSQARDSGRSSPAQNTLEEIADVLRLNSDTNDVTSIELQTVAAALFILKKSYDENELKTNLEKLINHIQEQKADVIEYLSESHAQLHVIAVLLHLPGSLVIQQVGCRLLYDLVNSSEKIRDEFVPSGGLGFLVTSLAQFRYDAEVQEYGLKIIQDLPLAVHDRSLLQKLAEVSWLAISSFVGDIDILYPAVEILRKILQYDGEALKRFEADLLRLLTERLYSDENNDSKRQIVLLFTDMCDTGDNTVALVKQDVHLTLMELCTQYPNTTPLMSAVMELLARLNKEECVQEILISNKFVQNGIFSILDILRLSEKVQSAGLRIIQSLVPRLLSDVTARHDVCQVVVKMIYTAMFTHIEHASVQIESCRTLIAILSECPDASKWIGDNTEDKQDPVHNMCLGAMLMFRKNADVYIAACEAIYWMAADNVRLCTSLMCRNAHLAVIEGLKRYRRSTEPVETGCRALRGLCIFLEKHKQLMVEDSAFSVLVDLLGRYENEMAAQNEIISTITCLADVGIVRHQCFVERVPERITESMTRYQDVLIQETGLEAFAVLAAAEGGADILVTKGALPLVLDAMEQHFDKTLIQKKGLMVLQMFTISPVLQLHRFQHRIVDTIYTSLKNFGRVKSIMNEICVAIQLFAEVSAEISNEFVVKGCHEFLFEILEEGEKDTALQELASECLYVLSQEQNLKSAMLVSACKGGNLAAMDCLLELGADVNAVINNMTPLYLAVLEQHELIVRHMLKQEVQDLQGPLSLSLRQGSHVITGLILQQLGYDKEGETIRWSSLDLKMLEPSWIITTLVYKRDDTDIDLGRCYLDKIRNSETKRRLRKSLKYSKSDPTATYSRVRIRYRRRSFDDETELTIEEPEITSSMSSSISPHSPTLSPKLKVTRSKSLDPSSMIATQSSPRRPTLPTILSISPTNDDEAAVFELSPTEAEEWKKTTLTGANISYSQDDPRHQIIYTPRNQENIQDSGVWMRKMERSPSPRESTSSIEDARMSPALRNRNLSAPTLPGLEYFHKLRFKRKGSMSETESGSQRPPLRPQLLTLDLSENHLASVDSLSTHDLSLYLARIKQIDLHKNNIKCLPENIHLNLPNLEMIDLSENYIQYFPTDVLRCQKIKELNICNNKVKQIVLENSTLKRLLISHNQIKFIPSNIGQYLPKLKELLLKKNDLMELPDSCPALTEIKVLDLSYNQIDSIPDNFLSQCTKLETLDLSYNHLTTMPSENLSPVLSKLSKLKVRHNSLAEKHPFYVPKFILELPSVRTVDLSENELTGLPPLNLWKSQTMKEFKASSNRITSIDLKDSKVWSKLEKLHLARNNLSQIPKEIGQLSCLCSLDFSHNRNISTLPDELGKCSKLYEMPTDGLELDIDRSLMQRRVKDIINYLHNRLKKAQRYYRMKLMIVGYGGRGKTTLLRTLMKKNTKVKDNKATVGVVVEDWKFPRYPRRSSEESNQIFHRQKKVDYTLNTWDFAGQEEFHSTHNCYLSNRAMYLVVFDLQKGMADIDDLKSWLASIRSRAPGCPVIVVGTHLDKLPKRDMLRVRQSNGSCALQTSTTRYIYMPEKFQVGISNGSRDEIKRREQTNEIAEKIREFNIKPGFPTITSVYLVDASSENENVEQLRNAIRTTADRFEIRGKKVMGEKIPASYVRLSEMLSDKAKCSDSKFPVIQHRELYDMVQTEELDLDEDELQQAIRFLHESGVLLHYDDTSGQLRDFYFIDPGWLCRMMAQVITVRQINPFISKDGILRKKDIDILFKGSSIFPENLIPQYIKLLEKFEIALPHSDTELLIPSRLPVARPDIHLPVQCRTKLIERIYRMPYVPIGLWFRLISRMVSLINQSIFKSLLKVYDDPRRILWRKGVYVYWSETTFFLIDSGYNEAIQTELIIVTVPVSVQGYRILGQIIDHLDSLIDEWYPGLTSIDPLMGQEILEKLVPCPGCAGKTCCHEFTLMELQTKAKESDYIMCPLHDGNLPLTVLAPDLVLGDMEQEFKLDLMAFKFEESTDNRLGDGGYGMVYKALYQNKDVAVKVFKEIADIPPLTMLRQEATILRCLNHPSVVSLVAVGIRPPVILLELAPCGTLGTLIKKGARDLKRPLQHRIAIQVAEGLVYLHRIMIVFRDMKPDNVLIFSTSMTATVNAKISDYGIARFTSLQGLAAQEGTLAFRAPEVVRKETYSFKADVFSFGLTMYNMITGRHPFDFLDSKGEMDRAIAEGMAIPQFERGASAKWPDMQTIVLKCLEYSPDNRPSASSVLDTLRHPEIASLQRVVPVSKSTTVECLTLQEVRIGGRRRMRLWVASGNSDTFMLSYFGLDDTSNEVKGQLFKYGRIMCMQQIHEHHLALGTQIGKVFVYNTVTCSLTHVSSQLQDSVLCMKIITGVKECGTLLVGLANGKIAIFTIHELIHDDNVDPVCLYPGADFEPVLCMEKLGYRVFTSCGTQLIVLNLSKGIFIDKIVETDQSRDASAPPISCMTIIKNDVYFTKRNKSIVHIWDSSKEKFNRTWSIDDILNLPKPQARVTALSGDNKALWIGTHDGHIALMDPSTCSPLTITHRYMRSVRCIISAAEPFVMKSRFVFTGALGLRELTDREGDKHTMCGYVLVWDAEFPQYARSVTEYAKRRDELNDNRYGEDIDRLEDSVILESD